MKLEVSSEQRFTCQQCGMCCRSAWIVVTPAEVARYRKVDAARWYTEGGATGAAIDPFEPVAHGHYRIRKRPDGACGFLSADNRCRIHEELGAEAKPLACRVYPFRFHPIEGRALVTTSASCPSIVRNEGELLGEQVKGIAALRAEWTRAFPETVGPLLFTPGRPIERGTLASIQDTLRRMLEPAGDGPADMARGVARMARWLEDLSRHRVARLKPAAFAEYVALTGRHAAEHAEAPPPGQASAITRLLSRGFLFTVLAVRDQAASPSPGIGRHLRRARHLAHLHGLAPATETVDRAALRRVSLDVEDPEVHRIVRHALRSTVDGLGTRRRPVLDELAVQIATLVAGIALAAMAAHREGRDRIDAGSLTTGITAAAQLAHADSGVLGSLLTSLAGGVDALRLLESWLHPGLRAYERPTSV